MCGIARRMWTNVLNFMHPKKFPGFGCKERRDAFPGVLNNWAPPATPDASVFGQDVQAAVWPRPTIIHSAPYRRKSRQADRQRRDGINRPVEERRRLFAGRPAAGRLHSRVLLDRYIGRGVEQPGFISGRSPATHRTTLTFCLQLSEAN